MLARSATVANSVKGTIAAVNAALMEATHVAADKTPAAIGAACVANPVQLADRPEEADNCGV